MAEDARRSEDSIREKAETTKLLIEQKYAAMRQQREERLQRCVAGCGVWPLRSALGRRGPVAGLTSANHATTPAAQRD